jgi:hypothetical protein
LYSCSTSFLLLGLTDRFVLEVYRRSVKIVQKTDETQVRV